MSGQRRISRLLVRCVEFSSLFHTLCFSKLHHYFSQLKRAHVPPLTIHLLPIFFSLVSSLNILGFTIAGGQVRPRLDQAKNVIPFLQSEDSKVLEFWQIWSESIPPQVLLRYFYI